MTDADGPYSGAPTVASVQNSGHQPEPVGIWDIIMQPEQNYAIRGRLASVDHNVTEILVLRGEQAVLSGGNGKYVRICFTGHRFFDKVNVVSGHSQQFNRPVRHVFIGQYPHDSRGVSRHPRRRTGPAR